MEGDNVHIELLHGFCIFVNYAHFLGCSNSKSGILVQTVLFYLYFNSNGSTYISVGRGGEWAKRIEMIICID